ncbi:hypothetical protein AKO1_000723, partial [Acrasis kona]
MTKFLSTTKPQITNSLGIYYTLSDMLNDVVEKRGKFKSTPNNLVESVRESIEKYDKYYKLMDSSLVYYVAATLDPRSKAVWMKSHLTDEDHDFIIKQVIEKIKVDFGIYDEEQENIPTPPSSDFSVNAMMLRTTQKDAARLSDVEKYYNSGVTSSNVKDSFQWVLEWWKDNQTLFPNMAKVARAYLAIPAASVSIERLFNSGRDVIDVRRHSMISTTFRWLILLKDYY